MNKQTIDKYLDTLYLKSKANLKNGYSYKMISAILGIDQTTSQNIVHYLSNKGLIDTKSNFGDNISLTSDGFDFIDALRENKTYKTVKFIKAVYVPPASKMEYGFLFWYNVTDESGNTEEKTIGVFASDILSMNWQLRFDAEGIRNSEKILLQFAKEEITEKIISQTLSNHEVISMLTATQPRTCPYKPENLVEAKYMEFEIEVGNNYSDSVAKVTNKEPTESAKDYPSVFISYSWDSEEHKKWVLDLTKRLFDKRVHVILDQFELRAGTNMIHFMETAIKQADKVLIVFTPNYKSKADKRQGGVGYEYSILNAELYHQITTNEKFIPILKSGEITDSIPSFMQQFIAVNMTDQGMYEEKVKELVYAIYEKPLIEKPQLGENPFI